MSDASPLTPPPALRRGWTTGACATAATKGALQALWSGTFPVDVGLVLPKGETPVFDLIECVTGHGWAQCGVRKDAGDDPDVTHGAIIRVRVRQTGRGVSFVAGEGVGMVTRPGLPIDVGEPAINPVPRAMMKAVVSDLSDLYDMPADVEITISVPGGAGLAEKTWNPRLGIIGGISILGTTGVVRPFSCAAWIASIHRGIDVARASGVSHVAGCTGATSEATVQRLFDMPDHAMLDMGDFAGGLLKYMRRHPVPRLTIGGGIGKMTKLAQGARDLHSRRSQVDFAALGAQSVALGLDDVSDANTALEAVTRAGPRLAKAVADDARRSAQNIIGTDCGITIDTVVIDRAGAVLAQSRAQ